VAFFFDLDNGGDPGIFKGNSDLSRLFRQEDQVFESLGEAGNRDAIGGRGKVTVGGPTRVAEKRSSGGYLFQNDPRLLFGPGGARRRIGRKWSGPREGPRYWRMFLAGKPSPSRDPRASIAGRAALTSLLGAAVALAAVGGFLGLRGGRSAPPGSLLSVAGGSGSKMMGMGVPERTYVAFASPDGKSFRNLTEDFHSASSPCVSFDGRRFLFAGRRTSAETPAIWERGIDRSRLRKVTEGNGDPSGPIYLPDGRILYSDRPGRGVATEARSLFSSAPDGSDVRRLTFGDQQDIRARLLADGRVRFERRILTPAPLPDPLDLVVHPDGTMVSAMFGRERDRGGEEDLPPVKPPKGDYVLGAVEAGPRAVPPALTSVIRTEWKTGTLLCLNAYASRIPAVADLPRGAIRRVRITTPSPEGEGELSAEARVMSDGSFFVEVPADTPLRIHLLGEGGAVLASFMSGVWVRANENHGCIGCHEDPDRAPENRQPLAVGRPPDSLLLALTRGGGFSRGR